MKSLFLMVIDPPLSMDINSWLVVEPTPQKNMSSSVGVILPNIWKNKIHVPNQQPDNHQSHVQSSSPTEPLRLKIN